MAQGTATEARILRELSDRLQTTTVGVYLAQRLEEVGIRHYFTVPGDYNLLLLDEISKNKSLQLINCCNELNAGYAADGYARSNGASALVVTYGVGGLSAINAVAGAYAEDLPMIVISGGPNSNSVADEEVLHHSLGELRYDYVAKMFAEVTAATVIIRNANEAPSQIDEAIATCLARRKPVYIEIACNITGAHVSRPNSRKLGPSRTSDKKALKCAIDHAVTVLNRATKPVLVGGVKLLRDEDACEEFQELVKTCRYATAVMPNAKGVISEENPNYIGIYWGPVSSPGTCGIVESADAYLFAGPLFSDYTTSGHSLQLEAKKLIYAGPNEVRIQGQIYTEVELSEFLAGLVDKLKPNDAALKDFRRSAPEKPIPKPNPKGTGRLTTQGVFAQIQQLLDANTTVIAETGDSWFNGLKLQLPEGAAFEIQMQYGSIGWSVGATLGYELGSPRSRRVVALIGDGSFQLTAQEVSTMIRYGVNPIIFLINNFGYTIEVEIHDGPYNNTKNWNYAALVDVFNAGDGNGISFTAETPAELQKAIAKAQKHDGVSLIEVKIDRDDCSNELLSWGKHVEINNGRPPRPRSQFP